MPNQRRTDPLSASPKPGVRRFRLQRVQVEGRRKTESWESTGERCSLGTDPSNQVVLADPTVSRFHCEIRIEGEEARVHDLESLNGTVVDNVRVSSAWLRHGAILTVGRETLQFLLTTERAPAVLSERSEFGSLVGASIPMRRMFAILERAAASDSTLLITGETGTGKEGAAEAVHFAGARRDKPFIVVDCSAMPAALIEAELFGHAKGAFTGATGGRTGALEEAEGGTIFLDEIGELPLELQPKLLRFLERRQIKRVGSNAHVALDVRVIAATNRDLRELVNRALFRADLYYRLAVLQVDLPPLRQRLDDLPLLVEKLLERMGVTPAPQNSAATLELISRASAGNWPGNVRELRNHLERSLVLCEEMHLPNTAGASTPGSEQVRETGLAPYVESRRRALERFEREYLPALIARSGGNITAAARAAGLDRAYLYRLLRRNKLGR